MRFIVILLSAVLFTLLFGFLGWAVFGFLLWKYWGDVVLLIIAGVIGTFLRSADGQRFVGTFRAPASGVIETQTNRVLTTVMPGDETAKKIWQKLHMNQPVLIKPEAENRWAVISEFGMLGYLDDGASNIVSFRNDAIGKPKGKILKVNLNNLQKQFWADIEITFAS